MKNLSIGQLAKKAQINIETIRYYERRGLIPKPPRSESGYRRFPLESVRRLRFIKRAKNLGFSLKEIGELLSLRLDPETSCYEVKRRAEAKISDIEEKVKTLQRMKRALKKVTEACDGRSPITQCPILDAFEKQSEKEI